MLVLITGGAGSGKSEFAERLIGALPGPLIYLATMRPSGPEAAARIARHHRMREGKGFTTVEQPLRIGEAAFPDSADVLLEDLSNLLANEMFDAAADAGDSVSHIKTGLHALGLRARNLILVTNEVFSDGGRWDAETDRWLRSLAKLNQTLAAEADLVVEVVCGLPNVLKGELSWISSPR